MICGGDEIGRTQRGNNNAYAQDNAISWIDWNLDERKKALLDFTAQLIALRKAHPNLHRRKFFQDRKIMPGSASRLKFAGLEVHDICWYRPDGQEMTEEEWTAGWIRCLGLRLSGRTLDDVDRHGELIRDESFLFCLNPHHENIQFYLPPCTASCSWELLIDTRFAECPKSEARHGGEFYDMANHSAVLFCETEQPREAEEPQREEMRKRHEVDLKHRTQVGHIG